MVVEKEEKERERAHSPPPRMEPKKKFAGYFTVTPSDINPYYGIMKAYYHPIRV